MTIRIFNPDDKYDVITLWRKCNLLCSWNDPEKDINRKLENSPGLFLVGIIGGKVYAAAMGGYEGHRGWINYLAVDPSMRNSGLGKHIMSEVELRLKKMGCPKINLQIRSDNINAVDFYKKDWLHFG